MCNLTHSVFTLFQPTVLHLLTSTRHVLWTAPPRVPTHTHSYSKTSSTDSTLPTYPPIILVCVFEFAILMRPKKSKQTDHLGSLSMALTQHPPLHVSSLTLPYFALFLHLRYCVLRTVCHSEESKKGRNELTISRQFVNGSLLCHMLLYNAVALTPLSCNLSHMQQQPLYHDLYTVKNGYSSTTVSVLRQLFNVLSSILTILLTFPNNNDTKLLASFPGFTRALVLRPIR